MLLRKILSRTVRHQRTPATFCSRQRSSANAAENFGLEYDRATHNACSQSAEMASIPTAGSLLARVETPHSGKQAGAPLSVLLIGVGPHSKRIYVPNLMSRTDIRIALAVDLDTEKKQKDLAAFSSKALAKYQKAFPVLHVPYFPPEQGLPKELESHLDDIVRREKIDAVIIATEPLVHRAYGMWALRHGLHILMDKPITTSHDAAVCPSAAARIETDYLDLLAGYKHCVRKAEAAGKQVPSFSVQCQRRHHVGHRKVLSLITEAAERFGVPVTGIESSHSDGQWRLPSEIVDEIYHGYNQGHGKVSHSGYHMIDLWTQFLQAGFAPVPHKAPDTLHVSTSLIRPAGVLQQFTAEEQYACLAAAAPAGVAQIPELSASSQHPAAGCKGEVDANILLTGTRDGEAVVNGTIALRHNTFSRRAWLEAGECWYKGNGRVKHEHHVINSGPLQTIHVRSFQANDKHDGAATDADDAEGGKNHFDVVVFRNAALWGLDSSQARQVYTMSDLKAEAEDSSEAALSSEGLAIESAKDTAMAEWLACVKGQLPVSSLVSNLPAHQHAVQLMSSIYKAAAQAYQSKGAPIHGHSSFQLGQWPERATSSAPLPSVNQ